MAKKKVSQLAKFSRISHRLNILMVGLLVLATCVGIVTIRYVSEDLEAQTRHQQALSMANNVSTVSTAIDLWVATNQRVVARWAQDPAVTSAIAQLLEVQPTTPSLLASPALAELREQFGTKLESFDAKGFFVIGPGNISYGSMRDENLGTVNYLGAQHPALLQRAWMGDRVVIPPVASDVPLDGRSDSARDYTSVFLALPIMDNAGSPTAVLTVRFDSTQTVGRILAGAHQSADVDVFAFDERLRFATPARHFQAQLAHDAVPREDLRFFDASVRLIARGQAFAEPTHMARLAIQGQSGQAPQGYESYFGQRVIGAWAWNQQLSVGIASEVPEQVALTNLWSAYRNMMALCIGVGVLGFVVIITSLIYSELAQRSAKAINTDTLTKLASRHYFNLQLADQLEVARRSGLPLTLMMIDVDQFKQYNDSYGHVQGDACLVHVGRSLTMVCRRTTDLAARVGGEEFALLLPMTCPTGAAKLAMEIQQNLRQAAIPHASSTVDKVVTCSIGVATAYIEDVQLTPTQLIEEADRNLYEAKRGGRNRVVATDPHAPSATGPAAPEQPLYPFDQHRSHAG